jgi:hypothetical protein
MSEKTPNWLVTEFRLAVVCWLLNWHDREGQELVPTSWGLYPQRVCKRCGDLFPTYGEPHV